MVSIEEARFLRLHRRGLTRLGMVVADDVEHTVDDQQREFVLD